MSFAHVKYLQEWSGEFTFPWFSPNFNKSHKSLTSEPESEEDWDIKEEPGVFLYVT